MGDITTASLLLGALVFSFVNFLRYVIDGDWSPAITQAIAWVSGVVAVLIFAGTQWADGVVLLNVSLASANVSERIIFGLVAASVFSPVVKIIQAIDHTQTAAVPPLIGPTPPPPADG
jgi:hypothetical protein